MWDQRMMALQKVRNFALLVIAVETGIRRGGSRTAPTSPLRRPCIPLRAGLVQGRNDDFLRDHRI